MKDLENKVAIVTGASSGIGKAVAEIYAKAGAKVVASDVNEEKGNEVVSEIKKNGGEAMFIKCDSSSSASNKELVEATIKRYGRLDIACNNAGIGGKQALTGDYSIEDWDKVIGINLSGVFYGMRYQIPEMLKAGGGIIVNMSSILGKTSTKMMSAYVASKHGVIGLTKAAALEYADQNIRINSVGPAYIKTPLLEKTLEKEQIDGLKDLHPIGRLGESSEVAELVLWLTSSKASFVTGSYYAVDGGYLTK